MTFSGQLIPGEAVAWICVASPDSRQNIQPVTAGDFFIGSGSSCHLRLGDDSIPEMLAGITAEGGCVQLRCHSPAPVMCLNGEPVEQTFLHDGDLLEVGPYRLIFCFSQAEARTAVPMPARVPTSQDDSAERVVDWLGEQIRVIDECQHTPEVGAAELRSAAGAADPDGTDGLMTKEVGTILRAIKQNQHALRQQNEAILEQLARLTRQSELIADSIEPSSDQVVPLRTHGSIPHRRASA